MKVHGHRSCSDMAIRKESSTRKAYRRVRQRSSRHASVFRVTYRAVFPLLTLWVAMIHSSFPLSTASAAVEEVPGASTDEEVLTENQSKTLDSSSSNSGNLRHDEIEDSLYDPLQQDPDAECDVSHPESCNQLPDSTIEQEVMIDATCSYGGDDPDQQICVEERVIVDKHWGSDPTILHMRDALRLGGNKRPPIFLMPGLASTRLVSWSHKTCEHPLLSDIKVQDNVWLNINLVVQMGTIDVTCMRECLKLGLNQSDRDHARQGDGCKLRPDEGLDAISSLGYGIASSLLVGGTNTVYAWLIQWLADNLGYDVSNIVGLPYDWRLSPDKMEERDGFLTLTRRRIEAAVQSNGGKPGIMVAHSMGNIVFRYFLEWLRMSLREEAYARYIKQADRRAKAMQKAAAATSGPTYTTSGTPDESGTPSSFLPGWMGGMISGFDEWWSIQNSQGASDLLSLPKHAQLWELAQLEGDDNWIEWIETHIWTYVGLSAPMLGAVNPLRAVISGENMGMPITDEAARIMEITFGSTHTVNPISSREGFCDQWDAERWDEEPSYNSKSKRNADARLACLDDIFTEVEYNTNHNVRDPWESHETLRALMKERRDWDSDFPMIRVVQEYCEGKEKSPCSVNKTLNLGPKQAQTGDLFLQLGNVWKEQDNPMGVKREQLRESFWDTKVTNILNRTWERPLIKHVILGYGVDIPTEVGYVYRKSEKVNEQPREDNLDGIPTLESVVWEVPGGQLEDERLDASRNAFAELLTKKKPKRRNRRQGALPHSGDGSVPYLSLSWAHTWLLHAVRALRHSGRQDGPDNPLDNIQISHRPKGAMEWKDGPPPERIIISHEKKVEESSDTGTAHPHGTKYKPEMVRYDNRGKSRTTGIEYTTTVIEAIGVEHKETTRNFDILAAVFTDVLRFMHDDQIENNG